MDRWIRNRRLALIFGILWLALVTACAGPQKEQPLPAPVVVTLETVTQYASKPVIVEGYLVADRAIHCDTGYCTLHLIPEPDEDGRISLPIQPSPSGIPMGYLESGIPFLPVRIPENLPANVATPSPNSMSPLRGSTWTNKDILVWTDQTEQVSLGDHVRVTGIAGVDDDGVSFLAPACRFTSSDCADPGFRIERLNP
jgi:hypothetical protein